MDRLFRKQNSWVLLILLGGWLGLTPANALGDGVLSDEVLIFNAPGTLMSDLRVVEGSGSEISPDFYAIFEPLNAFCLQQLPLRNLATQRSLVTFF